MSSLSNSNRFFRGTGDLSNLRDKTARGGAITAIGQMIRFVLQIGTTMFLARILSPDDFGLIGMVAVLVQLVVFFRDFGLTQATVQRKEITVQQVSNLFWINLFASVTIAGIFALSSSAIAQFYGRPELQEISLILAIGILAEGVSLQHRALMTRGMEYLRLTIVDVISQLVASTLAIFMALNGLGYWALVVLSLGVSLVRMFLIPLLAPWIPSIPRRGAGTMPYLGFGTNLFGFNLLNYFARNVDNVIIGRLMGAVTLGFYENAYRLLMLPMQQINGPVTQVVLPALSRLQEDTREYRDFYVAALTALSLFSVPISIFCFFFANDLIYLALGPGWGKAAEIFQYLAPAALMAATNVANGWVYLSLGTVNRQLRSSIISSLIHVVFILAGSRWGVEGVAISVSLSRVSMRLPFLMYAYKGTPITVMDFLATQVWPMILGVTCSATVYFLVDKAFVRAEFRVMFGGLFFVVLFFSLAALIPQTRKVFQFWMKQKNG